MLLFMVSDVHTADGYNRSDGCVVMFLQRVSEAKRSYGTLVNVKSMHFGDTLGQLVNYDRNQFKTLLLESYKESNIDPASVEFVEAYGSGIKVIRTKYNRIGARYQAFVFIFVLFIYTTVLNENPIGPRCHGIERYG